MCSGAGNLVPCPQCSNSIGSLGLAPLPASDPEKAQKNDCSEMPLQGEAFSPGGERNSESIPRVQGSLPHCTGSELCLCSGPEEVTLPLALFPAKSAFCLFCISLVPPLQKRHGMNWEL